MACGDPCPHGNTFIKRRFGAAYDPEIHCPYTGRRLFTCPVWGQGPNNVWQWSLLYWRDDAHLFRCRAMLPHEAAWADANRAWCEAEAAKVSEWLKAVRKDY